jgi:YgiT-type zinc finger domain-containing protein
MKNVNEKPQFDTCPECHVGRLKRRYVAYLTWIGRGYVTVPDFPAWVCDVCGFREYDTRAMRRLNLLLSPTVQEARGQHRKTDHLQQPPAG